VLICDNHGFTVPGMDTRITNDERLAAAHATLTEAVAKVATSEDWQNLLRLSGSFHRYSPNNQLLLAAQGAEGLVASFHTWKQIAAIDGHVCRIRKGETAVRVYAPIRAKRQELDEAIGETAKPEVVGFRLVPVFHQGQLVAPPDLPAQPKLLSGDDPPLAVSEAIADQINAAGYVLRRTPLDGPDGPKGVTSFVERTVTVRDDLGPAQALKTEIHELGHVLMHFDTIREPAMARDRMEVEAESVAYVVCGLLGVDAGSYSIPYVANWAGAEVELVQETAYKVLATARAIVVGLEAELGVDLRPNPIADAIAAVRTQTVDSVASARMAVATGTTDEIIHEHLATGQLDWQRLGASIPALELHRARPVEHDPAAQAIVLAEAGASPEANVAVMRAHGLDDTAISAMLTVIVPDALGATSTLYDPEEVLRAVRDPRPVKPIADEIVAELLVATGRHPNGARHLAETSSQPASVVNLMEERLRRATPVSRDGHAERAHRGLTLIDEWTGPPRLDSTVLRTTDSSRCHRSRPHSQPLLVGEPLAAVPTEIAAGRTKRLSVVGARGADHRPAGAIWR
jgi:hypothetical protein